MTIALLITALAAGTAGQAPSGSEVLTKEQAEARMATCGSRRFQSVAEFEVDGKKKRSRLELCAQDSATQAEWIATLEKNEAAIKAQTLIPESARFKLLSDLRAEIDRLKGVVQSVPVKGIGALALPKGPVAVPSSDFKIAALPPLPAPKAASPTAAGSPSIAASAAAAPARPAGLRPRLTVKCAVPGGAPIECDYFSLDDLFIVEADENLASPLTLTFRRTKSGDVEEITLRRLNRGEMARFKVPAAMCKGVVRTTFDVQVSGRGTGTMPYADTLGPFKKAC